MRHTFPVVTIVLYVFGHGLGNPFLNVEKIAKLASAFMVMMFILVNACVIIFTGDVSTMVQSAVSIPCVSVCTQLLVF